MREDFFSKHMVSVSSDLRWRNFEKFSMIRNCLTLSSESDNRWGCFDELSLSGTAYYDSFSDILRRIFTSSSSIFFVNRHENVSKWNTKIAGAHLDVLRRPIPKWTGTMRCPPFHSHCDCGCRLCNRSFLFQAFLIFFLHFSRIFLSGKRGFWIFLLARPMVEHFVHWINDFQSRLNTIWGII